jgi:hypothetical protein
MWALRSRGFNPVIIGDSMPPSDKFFCYFKHNQQRLLALKQVNEGHPWPLAEGRHIHVG